MFKSYQEHYERFEERRFKIDFSAFNPKHDRVKLIVSAILIPAGCSFFYFLHSGHKIAEIEIAHSNIENVQSEIDNDQIATRAKTVKPSSDSGSLIRTLNLKSSTGHTGDSVQETIESIAVNSQADDKAKITRVAGSNTQPALQHDNSVQTTNGDYPDVEKPATASQPASISTDTADEFTAGQVSHLLTLPIYNQGETENLLVINDDIKADRALLETDSNINQSPDSGSIISNEQLMGEESRIAIVEKIIGLLESEITDTDETAGTNNRKRLTNRVSELDEKSFDLNKLE